MLGHFRLLVGAFLLLISTYLSATSVMEDEEWQQKYHHNRVYSPEKALAMLQRAYDTIDPSAERIYIASRIHGFVTRRGNNYRHKTSNKSLNPYEQVEYFSLMAMDHDDRGEYQKVIESIEAALHISKSLHDPELDAVLSIQQCRLNLDLGNYYVAEFYCQSIIKYLEKTSSHYIDKKWVYRLLAMSYQGSSNYEAALLANEEALHHSKPYDINDTTYSNISHLLLSMGRLHNAKEFAQKALALRIQRNIPQKIAQANILLARIHLQLSQYDDAEILARTAIENLKESNNSYTRNIAYFTLGSILHKKGFHDEAIEYLLITLNSQEKESNSIFVINTYQVLSQIYLQYKNPNKAIEYILIAISKSETSQSLQELSDSLLILTDVYEFTQQYHLALSTQKKHQAAKNKIHAQDTAKAYAALKLRNTVIQTERELIESLKEQQEQQKELITSQRNRVYSQVIIIVLVVFLIFILRSRQKLNTLACKDVLTGANSRHHIFELIRKRLSGYHQHTALVMLDIDNFKQLNDKYGHPNGDLGLKHLYKTLERVIPLPHQIGRVGGEEFLLLLQEEGKDHCLTLIEQARQALESSGFDTLDGKKLSITASFSWIYLDKNMDNIDQLYFILDEGLYQAKQNGKNCIVNALEDEIT